MHRKMSANKFLLTVVVFVAVVMVSSAQLYADQAGSAVSGRLGATFDSETGTITAMIAGYSESRPITIGPLTWSIVDQQFSELKAEDIGKIICGKEFALKRVTKSANSGKEMVADIVIMRSQ